jgi:ubiquinone/menaquinone biosynthesis C-methylase UbiE
VSETYIHGTTTDEQRRLAKLNEMTNPAFLEFLELRGDERVLEVGSGLGLLAAEVARQVPRGEVVGVERSPEQLAQCPRDVPNLRFVAGDALKLPRDLGEFDVVYCRYLLEHVADPQAVLVEMRRVLQPGGRVLVQENDIAQVRHDPPTPTFDRVWRQFAELQIRLGGDPYVGRRLLPLLKSAGFRDVRLSVAPEVHYFGTPHYAAWVVNLADNVRGAATQLIGERLATHDEIAAAVAELHTLVADPTGAATFYWDRATAST